MKPSQKKVPKNFRLSPDVHEELKRRSEATGIDETRIVEDALRHTAASYLLALHRDAGKVALAARRRWIGGFSADVASANGYLRSVSADTLPALWRLIRPAAAEWRL
jgi:hypothetical protein